MQRRSIGLALGALCLWCTAQAQQTTVPQAGLRDPRPRIYTLFNARIVVKPGEVIASGALEISNGRISRVLKGSSVGQGTQLDMRGRTLFAGLIESQSDVSLQQSLQAPVVPGPAAAQGQLNDPGARHFSRRVRPELSAADLLKLDVEAHKKLRALGFTAALTAPAQGIFRGQSALIQLLDGVQVKDALLKPKVAQQIAFEMSFWPSDEYPGSLMGAIALIRQTYYDAAWQAANAKWQGSHPNAARVEANPALDALAESLESGQLSIFKADDELDFERIGRIADEFKLNAAILGNGYEYRRLSALIAAKRTLIVPLNFPELPKLGNPDEAINIDLATLAHWEQAPANTARLERSNVRFALTAFGLPDAAKSFWSNVRLAVRAGLSESAALGALTVTPAALLGHDDLGTLEVGNLANVLVADASLFNSDDAKIYQVWVDGNRFEINALDAPSLNGTWQLSGLSAAHEIVISGDSKPEAKAGAESIPISVEGDTVSLSLPGTWLGLSEGKGTATATVTGERMQGAWTLADGRLRPFSAQRTAAAKPVLKEIAKAADPIPAFQSYPAGAFGVSSAPSAREVLIKGATLWTLDERGAGRLDKTDIQLKDGKISAIGSNLSASSGALVINAEGRHVTPGIIDAHSHTAIARNVNEPSSAVTAEVRVGDVLDPTDISIYRQLAGGVTTAQLLHGSANPIGGQSAIIKFRWGESAEALKFAGAFPTIKFALGENVKQSNRGDLYVQRYPQTRMGVEQLLRDSFLAARQYDATPKSGAGPVRRNLRLEALAEIVNHQRFVNVHSYRQDEILMFTRLAAEFSLTNVTFQHVLEGYKVAEALESINAGASGFADWWGFKMEAYDAIPHNGAILQRNGVLTSFNSDSDEMARRLNLEAAKAIKYGDLTEIDALKLVTINPAKHLGISDRVGTLEVGKDADVVLWSGHPLSSLSRVDSTWIDGRPYFDRAQDALARERTISERERLQQKVLLAQATAPSEDKPPALTATKPVSLWQFQTHQGWLADFAAYRTIYHSGGDVNTCSAQEHQH